MRKFSIMLLIFTLAACRSIIPATTPAQLQYTPALVITINEETVFTPIFQVDYPDGWRVVKISIAGEPIELVFASPDDEMWIKISEQAIPIFEGTLDPNIQERLEIVEIDGTKIYTQGQSPIEKRELFDEIYQHVLDSIKIP
jgi:ABC-type transport system substrate-binding protein